MAFSQSDNRFVVAKTSVGWELNTHTQFVTGSCLPQLLSELQGSVCTAAQKIKIPNSRVGLEFITAKYRQGKITFLPESIFGFPVKFLVENQHLRAKGISSSVWVHHLQLECNAEEIQQIGIFLRSYDITQQKIVDKN